MTVGASGRSVRRTITVLLLTVAVLIGAGSAAWAAWSARVTVSAGVSSGTWSTPPSTDPESGTGLKGDRILTPAQGIAFTTPVTWTDWTQDGPAAVADSLNGPANRGRRMCAQVTVRSAGDEASPWRVVIDYSGAPYYGEKPTYWDGIVTDLDDHRIQITSYQPLAPGTIASLSLCYAGFTAPAAVTAQAPWHVAQGDLRSDTLGGNAAVCRTVTVTGDTDTATYPFYYGWTATVDPSDLASAFRKLHGTDAHYFSVSPDPGGGEQMTVDGATTGRIPLDDASSAHTIGSGWQTALQGRGVYTFSACVTQW